MCANGVSVTMLMWPKLSRAGLYLCSRDRCLKHSFKESCRPAGISFWLSHHLHVTAALVAPLWKWISSAIPTSSAHAVFSQHNFGLCMLADVQWAASVQNIFACILSLKHILGLLSWTKLKSRCNLTHLLQREYCGSCPDFSLPW